MAPEFVKLHAEAIDFAVAEVDCTTSETLCEKYKVEGYPTLRLFVSGHYVEYEGERKAKDIASWVQ
jgi:thioredoxin-like negative regulator of GroEL